MQKCEICGYSDYEIIGEKQISDIQTQSSIMSFNVRLVVCKKCGVVSQNPLQDENKLFKYYSHMYREEKCRPRPYVKEKFKARTNFLSRFRISKNQRLLEVGCADGTTLLTLKNKGFIVQGIEPSIENAKLCWSKGLECFNGNYQDFETSAQRFDFICSYYVMEHLTSPVDFLIFCNRHSLCANIVETPLVLN